MASASTADDRAAGMRSALRNADCRRLLASMAVSVAGDWLYNVALLVFVFERTGSATWVGAATVVRLLPYVVFGAIGGAIADRYPRRTVMVVCDLGRGVLMGLLALVAATSAPAAIALLIAFAATCLATPYVPAVAATMPAIVGERDLAAANALTGAVEHTAIIVGPAIGGLLLAAGPPSLAFALNGATFAASASIIATLRLGGAPAREADERRGLLTQVAAGGRALAHSAAAVALVGCMMAGTIVYGAETVLLVLVSETRLGLGEAGLGYLMSAVGAGGVLAAAATGRIASSTRTALPLVAAIYAMGVPVAMLAWITRPSIGVPIMVLQGAGNIIGDVIVITALQRSLPSEIAGAVFGILGSLVVATTLVGALVAPAMVAAFGLEPTLAIVGLAVPALTLAALPTMRHAERAAALRVAELEPVVSRLTELPLLRALPRQSLELLAGAAVPTTVAAGETVVREGEPAEDFYLVRDGTLDVLARGEDHKRARRVNVLVAGDYFGEIGLIEGIPRTATVRARTAALLERIDGRAFLQVLNQAPSLSGTILDGVVGRLARTHPHLAAARKPTSAPTGAGG